MLVRRWKAIIQLSVFTWSEETLIGVSRNYYLRNTSENWDLRAWIIYFVKKDGKGTGFETSIKIDARCVARIHYISFQFTPKFSLRHFPNKRQILYRVHPLSNANFSTCTFYIFARKLFFFLEYYKKEEINFISFFIELISYRRWCWVDQKCCLKFTSHVAYALWRGRVILDVSILVLAQAWNFCRRFIKSANSAESLYCRCSGYTYLSLHQSSLHYWSFQRVHQI